MNRSMPRPLITIAIPNFNYGRYLKLAIDSALASGRQDIEVVVADNCSTDNSREILESYSDSRLRVFNHSENIGLYPNWNFVLKEAKGIYFKLLQSDDWLAPSFYEHFFEAFERYPETDIFLLGHQGYVGNRESPTRTTLPNDRGIRYPFVVNASASLALRALSFSMPTLNICRHDLLLQAGGYHPETNMRTDTIAFAKAMAAKVDCVVTPINQVAAATYLHQNNDRRRYTTFEGSRDEVLFLRALNSIEYNGGNHDIQREIQRSRMAACFFAPFCIRKPRGREMWRRFFREIFSERLYCFDVKVFGYFISWLLVRYKAVKKKKK